MLLSIMAVAMMTTMIMITAMITVMMMMMMMIILDSLFSYHRYRSSEAIKDVDAAIGHTPA